MKCKRCGCYIGEYSGHGRPPKYCIICADIVDSLKHISAEKRVYATELGTTDMKSKMSRDKEGKPDFRKERNIVRKELKKLRLRK